MSHVKPWYLKKHSLRILTISEKVIRKSVTGKYDRGFRQTLPDSHSIKACPAKYDFNEGSKQH